MRLERHGDCIKTLLGCHTQWGKNASTLPDHKMPNLRRSAGTFFVLCKVYRRSGSRLQTDTKSNRDKEGHWRRVSENLSRMIKATENTSKSFSFSQSSRQSLFLCASIIHLRPIRERTYHLKRSVKNSGTWKWDNSRHNPRRMDVKTTMGDWGRRYMRIPSAVAQ